MGSYCYTSLLATYTFKMKAFIAIFLAPAVFSLPVSDTVLSSPQTWSISKYLTLPSSSEPLGLSYPYPTYTGPVVNIPYVTGLNIDSHTKKILLDSIQTQVPAFSYSIPNIHQYENRPYLHLG